MRNAVYYREGRIITDRFIMYHDVDIKAYCLNVHV